MEMQHLNHFSQQLDGKEPILFKREEQENVKPNVNGYMFEKRHVGNKLFINMLCYSYKLKVILESVSSSIMHFDGQRTLTLVLCKSLEHTYTTPYHTYYA